MKAKTMDYFIPFPEDLPDEGKLEKYSTILMQRLSLQMDDDDTEATDEVVYQFPKGIKSDAGKIILTIDFLITSSGKRIGELFHLNEEELRTMVSIKWMMDLVPKDEMVILGKELHDAGLLKIYGEVKRKIFEECTLRQWKHRMEDDERLRIGDEGVVINKNMFIQKDT
jgi:hypothetical protein